MSSLGYNIKQARIAKGLSQEELAAKLGVTKAAISRYELGTREPSLKKLNKIASVLGVPLANLEGFERIDSKKFFQAVKTGDFRAIEKLVGLPEGSMQTMSSDETENTEPNSQGKKQFTEPTPMSDEDIKFALFGSQGEITDEMYDEVRAFAEFVRQREEAKKNPPQD